MTVAKKPAKKVAAAKKPGERELLLSSLAEKLSEGEAEVELRALRELAERHGLGKSHVEAVAHVQPKEASKGSPAEGPRPGLLPRRLFVLLDGRGLDGRGLPIEVLQSPTLIGSGRMCAIWVNSPQIETRHLQIIEEDGRWLLKDLKSEKGTLFNEEPLTERELQNGDEFKLAGYLRMRVEFH